LFWERIPRARLSLIWHSLYVGVVEDLLSHHSKRSSMERWSQNTMKPLLKPEGGHCQSI